MGGAKNCKKMDTLSVHSCQDQVLDNSTDKNEASQTYSIPVVNRFHTLQPGEGSQIGMDGVTNGWYLR